MMNMELDVRDSAAVIHVRCRSCGHSAIIDPASTGIGGLYSDRCPACRNRIIARLKEAPSGPGDADDSGGPAPGQATHSSR